MTDHNNKKSVEDLDNVRNMIEHVTLFIVRIRFDPRDYGPMTDDESWRSPHESMEELCQDIDRMAFRYTSVGDITHVFRGNPVAGPYFELETRSYYSAYEINRRIQDLIIRKGGRVL